MRIISIIVVLLCLLLTPLNGLADGTVTNSNTLVSLKNVWLKNDIYKMLDWQVTHHSVQGGGIDANAQGELLKLDLNGKKLYGMLAIVEMDYLTAVYAADNDLDGAVFDRLPITEIIDIKDNSISSLGAKDAWSDMPNLKTLLMQNNLVPSIAPLVNLTSLEVLNANHNRIKDLSPLAAMTGLRELYIGDNNITDLSALSGLVNLKSLNLSKAYISDLSALQNLKALTRLELREAGPLVNSYRTAPDLSGIGGFKNLKKLDIAENNLKDISFLKDAPQLEALNAAYNQLNNISILAEFKNLTELDLSNNYIRNIDSLHGLRLLQKLNLSRNHIIDAGALAGLTQLEELDLSANVLSDIDVLHGLDSLKTLKLAGNRLPLHKLYAAKAERTELGPQWGVYFVKRVQYLPACNYYDVPEADLVIEGEPSVVVAMVQDYEGEQEGLVPSKNATYDPATGRVTFTAPGEYHIVVTNAKVSARDSFDYMDYTDVKETRVSSGLVNVIDTLPTGEWCVTDENRSQFNDIIKALQQQGFVQADDLEHPLLPLLMLLYEEYCC